jgi:hypothetical protein
MTLSQAILGYSAVIAPWTTQSDALPAQGRDRDYVLGSLIRLQEQLQAIRSGPVAPIAGELLAAIEQREATNGRHGLQSADENARLDVLLREQSDALVPLLAKLYALL